MIQLLNSTLNTVSRIENKYKRRAAGLVLFIITAIGAVLGCLIELIIKCSISVFNSTLDYSFEIKDSAKVYFDRSW